MVMMMRVGIIGCGGIAPIHMRAYRRLKNVDVVGLCDLNLVKARNLAAKFSIDKVYEDHWDMLAKADLDLVDISTAQTAFMGVPDVGEFKGIETHYLGRHGVDGNRIGRSQDDVFLYGNHGARTGSAAAVKKPVPSRPAA